MQARNLIDLEDVSKEDLDEIIRLAGMISMADNVNRILDRVSLYLG